MKKQIIKKVIALFPVALVLLFIACEKHDDLNVTDVTGTYIGTLTGDFKLNQPATTIVSSVDDHIEVHCISENFDKTITLDIYNNGNRMMVCFNGDDFENMYGHMLGEGNMNHNNSNWMQHLNDEHQDGDEHYGYFDMEQLTFEFIFQLSDGEFNFQGTKN